MSGAMSTLIGRLLGEKRGEASRGVEFVRRSAIHVVICRGAGHKRRAVHLPGL
jgi:hypothetical protein